MFKKLLLLFTVLLIQMLPLQEAQATTGYTSWNDYARKFTSCDSETAQCSNFAEGQKIYMIVYSICTFSGNTCTSVKNYSKSSNDPYSLMNISRDSINAIYRITQGYEFSYIAREINQYGLNYDTYKPLSGGGEEFTGGGIVSSLNIPLCTGFISGYGCPNQSNEANTLERTKIKDGPCDTCSKLGNPFDVRNGAKMENVTDLDFPLSVQRLYYSRMKSQGMFGLNWKSNFDKKVKIMKNSNNQIISLGFITPDDQEIIYTSTDGATFTPAYNDTSQYKATLVNGNIVLLKPDSGLEYYNLITGRITSEIFKGQTLNYQYDNNGLLYRVTDSLGRYLQFFFSSYANVIEQITASNGDVLQYGYSGGNVSTVSFNGINQIGYDYSGSLLTGKRDGANVQYAVFTYDSKGRGIENKWITTDGHDIKKYTFSYANDNQTVVTQGNGFSRTYSLSTLNYETKIQSLNWNGFTEQNNFDTNGNITTKKDFNGTYENYTYDSAGRIITYSKDGKQKNISWDTANNIVMSVSETSANGTRTTSYAYDNNLNITQKTIVGAGDSMTWSYSWTSGGRILSETAPDGLTTNYSYNAIDNSVISGLLSSITTNSGQSMVINSYDVRGNPTSITVNGVNKTMVYDYKGRVLSESTAGITNNYTYDIHGNIITAQMANGYQLSMNYDSASRLLSIQDNMGGSSNFTTDDYTGENLSTSILQNNSLVRARNKVIDALGRTTESWNATVRTKRLANYYNYIDKPNSTTDANGHQSSYGWNSRNQMINYSGGGDSSAENYDIDNNKISVNVNSQSTTMSYDDFGRIIQLNSADTGNHTYAYSTSNRTISHTDSKGIVHSSSNDLNGNPISISHAGNGNTQNESYSYNNNGELTGFSDNSGSTSYVRNTLGQITNKTQNIGSKSFAVQYGYDNLGQKISETYPSGLVVGYNYSNGFLSNISVGGTNVVSNIQYNSILKEAVSWNLGGNAVSINKDADGLLTGFSDNGIFNQTITTNNEGHVISLNDNKSLYYNFAYNSNLYGQTDGITNYNFNPPYSNNKVGNFNDADTYKYFYYQYDLNGNTISDNKGSYTYDLKNNMTNSTRMFTENSQQVTKIGNYAFNALGHRVSKTVSGQIRYFAYNENNQLIGEYDLNGSVIAEYVYFGLRPVAVKTGSNVHIVHTDYLTTPRAITSEISGNRIFLNLNIS
jgi:YD repeat-containing protein